MRVLSFDCANRSLAVAELIHDPGETDPVKALTLVAVHVFDLCKGKKLKQTTKAERFKELRNILDTLPTPDMVYIEYQMAPNRQSGTVSDCIQFYYVNTPTRIVGGSKKNTIALANGLQINKFYERYSCNYTANKAHSKANFIHFAGLKCFDYSHIPRKNLDDVADAVCQVIACVYENNRKTIGKQ